MKQIHINNCTDEKTKAEEMSKLEGISLSAWIRRMINVKYKEFKEGK